VEVGEELRRKNARLEKVLEDLNTRLQQIAAEGEEDGAEGGFGSHIPSPPIAPEATPLPFSPQAAFPGAGLPSKMPSPRSIETEDKLGVTFSGVDVEDSEMSLEKWDQHIKSLQRSLKKAHKDLERQERRAEAVAGATRRLRAGQPPAVRVLLETAAFLQEEVYPPDARAWPSEIRWEADDRGIQRLPLSKLPPGERRKVFALLMNQFHHHQTTRYEQTHFTGGGTSLPPIFGNNTNSLHENSLAHHGDDHRTLTTVMSNESLPTQFTAHYSSQQVVDTAEKACQTPWVASETYLSGTRSRAAMAVSTLGVAAKPAAAAAVAAAAALKEKRLGGGGGELGASDDATLATHVSELTLNTRDTRAPQPRARRPYLPAPAAAPPGTVRPRDAYVLRAHKPTPPSKGGTIGRWPA